jgi:eukaryotic-like serine/threonine-protein kinase
MNAGLAGDPAFRARFEREARSAARIDHPAVVDVHDQGDDGERLFLVMELVEGGTLRDVLRARGAVGVPAAVAVLDPVLAGLAEAHRLGLVHRDVKPENVLISRTGEVKVADFGLVVAAAQAGASHAGMILGTVAYLSPEQVVTGRADPRSDVYAAGVLLYELLTGAPPHTGDTAISVAYRHVNADVPAPSLVAGDVPPELDDLVRRATSRDAARRPADAAVLLAELRRTAARLEVSRVPVPVPPPRPVDEQVTAPAGPRRVPAGGTRPQPAAGAGPAGTRALDRPVPGRPGRAAHAAHAAPRGAGRRPGGRLFALWVALVAVLALAVGVAAWWLGSGRWTSMPSVVGLQESAAQQLLAQADLVARRATAFDGSAPEGAVVAADRQVDAWLLRGDTVVLTVSAGRPEVPRVAPGTAVADAEAAVRGASLVPVAGPTEFSDVPAGAVTRTEPAAGAELAPGEPVALVTSRGPEPVRVRVPSVVGESASDAAAVLADRGLAVEAREALPFGIGRGGRVVQQDPGPGAVVDPGTTIVVTTL